MQANRVRNLLAHHLPKVTGLPIDCFVSILQFAAAMHLLPVNELPCPPLSYHTSFRAWKP